MKFSPAIFLFIAVFPGCKKEEKMCCMPAETNLSGKWVDVNKREDTLEVYTEAGRGILFDNSAYYRNNLATISDKNAFRMIYQFKDGRIGVKQFSAPANAEFNYFEITWIKEGLKFTMLQNAIRPYISSLPLGTYERAQ